MSIRGTSMVIQLVIRRFTIIFQRFVIPKVHNSKGSLFGGIVTQIIRCLLLLFQRTVILRVHLSANEIRFVRK